VFYQLPWLAEPTAMQRDALQHTDWHDGTPALERLAQIAGLRWAEPELARIGRMAHRALGVLGGSWRQEAGMVGLTPLSLLIFSSNTSAHLVEPLMATALARGFLLKCEVVEYQEPEVWLGQYGARIKGAPPDVILLSLDRISLRLDAAIGDVAAEERCVQSALDRLFEIRAKLCTLTNGSVIVENLPASLSDAQANIDAWMPGAPRHVVATFNQRLASFTSTQSSLLFDVAGLAALVGQSVWDAGRYWYTAKFPFSPACVPLYAYRLVSLLASLQGKSRRVLVLDLDNTIWGGVIGDDGVDGIVLGGNGAVGTAYVAIQEMALSYRARGVVLCVSSKNTEEVALEAFRRHPEMRLRESDITLFRINWESKAVSILAMAETLSLSLEAFVFLDDNPVERKQVRDALPGVAVPELPQDPSAWLPIFQAAGFFEQQGVSEEDARRSEYYKGNAERAARRESAADEMEFLRSLKMVMKVAPFDAIGRKRIAQLIAKSNQFNLTTRRYSEAQVAELESDPRVLTLQIRLSDVFGDNGMISVIVCRQEDQSWDIDTWLMSCRVLNREVEFATLNILAEKAKRSGANQLRGRYIPTAKNGIVRDLYAKLGFIKVEETAGGETIWILPLQGFVPKQVLIDVIESVPA
jgi:FkbH-like protein